MIFSISLPIALVALLLSFCTSANADTTEKISADFLEFLLEIEETTGDGFDAWLDDESSDQLDEINTISAGSNQ